jgi:hypothetical protein
MMKRRKVEVEGRGKAWEGWQKRSKGERKVGKKGETDISRWESSNSCRQPQ